MTGLFQVFCGLLLAGAVLTFAVCASRRSHTGSEPRTAAASAAPRPRATAAGGMPVTAVTVQPRGEITGPYGYDNGLVVAREES